MELGHKPDFFKDLFAKFRNNPINFGNANTDFLRFAQFCSEVAEEDLTEFFDFYGFFNKVGKDVTYKYNDDFYDKAYGGATISISQEDINACTAAMAKYPQKNTNLIFIQVTTACLVMWVTTKTSEHPKKQVLQLLPNQCYWMVVQCAYKAPALWDIKSTTIKEIS